MTFAMIAWNMFCTQVVHSADGAEAHEARRVEALARLRERFEGACSRRHAADLAAANALASGAGMLARHLVTGH